MMVPNIAKMALKVGLFKKQGHIITIKALRTSESGTSPMSKIRTSQRPRSRRGKR
jgi:hypothetical protein